MAINRDRLIQLGSNTGVAAYDWFPPSHYNCSVDRQPLYPYDPEAAKQMLAEAGYPDGFKTEGWFRVVRPWLSRIPEAVQQDLAAIGVEVELLQLESAVATEKLNNGELPIFIQAWGASFPDPFNFATELFLTGSTYSKRWRYSNPEVDELITQARQNTDPQSRCAQWLQVQDRVMEDSPAVPLFIAGYPDVRSPRLEDFAYHHTYHRPRYERVWIAPENRR
jgi:peptide/nickel transport system substrate-binding protein